MMRLRLVLVAVFVSLAGGFVTFAPARSRVSNLRIASERQIALRAATQESEGEAITFYGMLGVPSNASMTDIKTAYRNAVRSVHPDSQKSADDERFRTLTEAYKTLTDPQQRQAYDSKIRADKVAAFATQVAGLGLEIVKDVGIPVAAAAVKDVAMPFLMRTAKQSAAAATAAAGKAQKSLDEGAPLGEIATNAFAAAGEAAKRSSLAQDLTSNRKKSARVTTLLDELRVNQTELSTKLRGLESGVADNEKARTSRFAALKFEDKEYERLQQMKDTASEEAARMEEAGSTALRDEVAAEKAQEAARVQVSEAEQALEQAVRELEIAKQKLRESKRAVVSSREDMNKADRELMELRDRCERTKRYSAISQERLNDSIRKLRAREESREQVREELRRLDIERRSLLEQTDSLRPKLKITREKISALEKRSAELSELEAALRQEEQDQLKGRK